MHKRTRFSYLNARTILLESAYIMQTISSAFQHNTIITWITHMESLVQYLAILVTTSNCNDILESVLAGPSTAWRSLTSWTSTFRQPLYKEGLAWLTYSLSLWNPFLVPSSEFPFHLEVSFPLRSFSPHPHTHFSHELQKLWSHGVHGSMFTGSALACNGSFYSHYCNARLPSSSPGSQLCPSFSSPYSPLFSPSSPQPPQVAPSTSQERVLHRLLLITNLHLPQRVHLHRHPLMCHLQWPDIDDP